MCIRDRILEYFNNYRLSKISDTINERVSEIVSDKNANSTSFSNWYENFKTVKTILHNRSDIDVFYWIDGLGVDWIPFVRSIIDKFSKEHVYLNEIHIAVADLPTTTAANKPILQSLLPDNHPLEKIGDLDSFAHSSKNYPQYIIDEMNILEKAIIQVLDKYTGKKIAFISDHGVTYLAPVSYTHLDVYKRQRNGWTMNMEWINSILFAVKFIACVKPNVCCLSRLKDCVICRTCPIYL